MVFPYRGIYVRHLGGDDAVAEANQVLFFNAHEGYRVSHPVPGGDASLDLVVSATCRLTEPVRRLSKRCSPPSPTRSTIATGVRIRRVPFRDDRVLAALKAAGV